MTTPTATPSTDQRTVLKSQFHAAMAMLRLGIERCPDDLWMKGIATNDGSSSRPLNATWRIAYHTLYFTHLYLQPTAGDFEPWTLHQIGLHDLDDHPSSPEQLALTNETDCPLWNGEPLTQSQLLDYWQYCFDRLDDWIDAIDLTSPESGFPWYRVSKLEHVLVALRHIQHHTGQIGARLREASRGNNGIDWVGAGKKAKRVQFPQG